MELKKVKALEWAIEEAACMIGGRDPADYEELSAELALAREALEELKSMNNPIAILSSQEREVFKRIAAGFRPAQVADELKLSVKTVSTYRARIMQKLGLSSNAEMAILAYELNLANGIAHRYSKGKEDAGKTLPPVRE